MLAGVSGFFFCPLCNWYASCSWPLMFPYTYTSYTLCWWSSEKHYTPILVIMKLTVSLHCEWGKLIRLYLQKLVQLMSLPHFKDCARIYFFMEIQNIFNLNHLGVQEKSKKSLTALLLVGDNEWTETFSLTHFGVPLDLGQTKLNRRSILGCNQQFQRVSSNSVVFSYSYSSLLFTRTAAFHSLRWWLLSVF